MSKVYWEKEKTVVSKQLMSKKTKQNQLLWNKVNGMQDSIKEAVIKVYLERCKLRYMIRYLEWRLDFKLASANDEVVRSS